MGDIVTAYGPVTGRDDEPCGSCHKLRIWCCNQRVELTAVGTASAPVK
jgi:hypothetical protein